MQAHTWLSNKPNANLYTWTPHSNTTQNTPHNTHYTLHTHTLDAAAVITAFGSRAAAIYRCDVDIAVYSLDMYVEGRVAIRTSAQSTTENQYATLRNSPASKIILDFRANSTRIEAWIFELFCVSHFGLAFFMVEFSVWFVFFSFFEWVSLWFDLNEWLNRYLLIFSNNLSEINFLVKNNKFSMIQLFLWKKWIFFIQNAISLQYKQFFFRFQFQCKSLRLSLLSSIWWFLDFSKETIWK